MEDLFGQIECRTKSDSMVMRILRSAMDKTHEKLQSKDGPIQFLHNRSMFYELATILVESGLRIIEDQTTDILEDNGNKIFSDLTEIKDWLYGRIQDMKHLIAEKDTELADRLENELKLQQLLDIKEREILYLHEKLDPERAKSDDIIKLKSSVDQQVSNIKQKLEDEKRVLNIERRIKKTRVSSPSLSFDLLDNEMINGRPVFREDCDSCSSPFGIPNNQNVLIGRMSSDMDVLKETLDLAFGRMQSNEAFPLERQWRCAIEKDIESILVKGLLNDVRPIKEGGEDDLLETKRNTSKVDSLLIEIDKLKEERDRLCFQNSLMEDTYLLLLSGMKKNMLTTGREEKSVDNIDFMKIYLESVIQQDLYAIFLNETIKRWKEYSYEMVKALELINVDISLECFIREDIYLFVVIQAAKEFNAHLWKSEQQKQTETPKDSVPRQRESEPLKQIDLQDDIPHSWRKLEADIDKNLSYKLELKDNYCQLQLNDVSSIESGSVFMSDGVLGDMVRFQGVVSNFEHVFDETLKRKFLRLDVLKHEVGILTKHVALMRKRKSLYKRAFFSKCHNLKLAEIEVDLLGDQVESLLCLLEKLYFELNQNATLLSSYFKVYDMLTLIERQLTI